MELESLKKHFYRVIAPSLPNEWEVEDVLAGLLELPKEDIELLLQQVAVIWPVSHSLCFAYLEDGRKSISIIPGSLVPEWTRKILGLYETGGLYAARKFIADPAKLFLGALEGKCGVPLSEIRSTMQLYLDGISGGEVDLGVAAIPQTDTEKIDVPEFIDTFAQREENFLLYKFLISLQWMYIESRLYEHSLKQFGDTGKDEYFANFQDPVRARLIFSMLLLINGLYLLAERLPGLVRSFRPLYLRLLSAITPLGDSNRFYEMVKELLVSGYRCIEGDVSQSPQLSFLVDERDVFQKLPRAYSFFEDHPGDCNFGDFSLLLGHFNYTLASAVITKRRTEAKNSFISLMAEALDKSVPAKEGGQKRGEQDVDSLRLILNMDEASDSGDKEEYLINNGEVELSEELKSLIEKIEVDLGELPEAYVQAAAGMAGRGVNSRESRGSEDSWCEVVPGPVGYPYDEWDYRRGGYRKNWCTLYEKPLAGVKSTFIVDALEKYKGQLHRIRRQFEMLRTQHRFIRRRRHGDDIDLDALIDALGDSRAGLVPSDRLFLRLLKDRRDISTCFLVDMSNSTEGWVGTAVKEALVLMAEAMEVVGDPYSIYGFSGMRRSKSELYPVKEMGESYSDAVKERIASISPREYTRMGPPIRHVTGKMLEVDSRVRLLIVFTDGKPEDYDDYKGMYAIEDTRKAILEARGCGLRVFCITIDKSAHDYLGHMFGRGQFVFLDTVESLPGKLVEMYRLLTC